MKEFLEPTPTIDCRSPAILAQAREISRSDVDPDEEALAARCFYWVRDQVGHSMDFPAARVTCTASEVLEFRTGFCFAKSHLLVALLRSLGIPAGLCYQRLVLDRSANTFCLHGLVAVHLPRHGWYRIDPRGDKEGISTEFCPPVEKLAFDPSLPGETNLPGIFPDVLPGVLKSLQSASSVAGLAAGLPDQDCAV